MQDNALSQYIKIFVGGVGLMWLKKTIHGDIFQSTQHTSRHWLYFRDKSISVCEDVTDIVFFHKFHYWGFITKVREALSSQEICSCNGKRKVEAKYTLAIRDRNIVVLFYSMEERLNISGKGAVSKHNIICHNSTLMLNITALSRRSKTLFE